MEEGWVAWVIASIGLYLLAIIAAWACIRDSFKRLAVVLLLSVPPLAFLTSGLYKSWKIHSAKALFERLCADERLPAVLEPAKGVGSMRTVIPEDNHSARHAAVALPAGNAAPLVPEAHLSAAVEQPTHSSVVDNARVPGTGRDLNRPKAEVILELRGVEPLSDHVTSGTFVIRDMPRDRVIVELRSYVLNAPDAWLVHVRDSGVRLAFGSKRACPSSRELAGVINNAARPMD
jgi:hypothetical protein